MGDRWQRREGRRVAACQSQQTKENDQVKQSLVLHARASGFNGSLPRMINAFNISSPG